MCYISAHAPRRDAGLCDTAHSRKQRHQVGGSLEIHSPTSHSEQDHGQYQNHPLAGTLNWMIPVLLYMAVNSLLSAWKCLHGKQPERRTKPIISRPCPLPWTSKQAKRVNCPVTLRRKSVPLSQLLIISEKGILVQRKWSQQSSGEGERAPPCWWHPSGCAGVLSSALTKETKQVI